MEKQLELTQLQEISQKMLGLAEVGDWDKLPELENERKRMMLSFFDVSECSQKLSSQGLFLQDSLQDLSLQDSAQIAQVIKEVLSINVDISKLAEQAKLAIGQQLQGMKKRQNVHTAYLQNK